MRKFLSILLLCCSLCAFAEKHDIKAFYKEISLYDAKRNGFDETYDGRYFIKTRLKEGYYEVEVGDKLDSKFYGIRYSNLFMLFRYPPYLYKFDEGVVHVTNGFDAGEYIEQ